MKKMPGICKTLNKKAFEKQIRTLFSFSRTFQFEPHKRKKAPSPKILFRNSASVRLQGLEPWTRGLRVRCSTN